MEYTKGEWGTGLRKDGGSWVDLGLTQRLEIKYEGDAHLIAAAPDLYEALRGICEEYDVQSLEEADYSKPWVNVLNALAKVEN